MFVLSTLWVSCRQQSDSFVLSKVLCFNSQNKDDLKQNTQQLLYSDSVAHTQQSAHLFDYQKSADLGCLSGQEDPRGCGLGGWAEVEQQVISLDSRGHCLQMRNVLRRLSFSEFLLYQFMRAIHILTPAYVSQHCDSHTSYVTFIFISTRCSHSCYNYTFPVLEQTMHHLHHMTDIRCAQQMTDVRCVQQMLHILGKMCK